MKNNTISGQILKKRFSSRPVLNADPPPGVFFADDITPALNCTPGDLPFDIPFQVSDRCPISVSQEKEKENAHQIHYFGVLGGLCVNATDS